MGPEPTHQTFSDILSNLMRSTQVLKKVVPAGCKAIDQGSRF